jgi:hypothetical protein
MQRQALYGADRSATPNAESARYAVLSTDGRRRTLSRLDDGRPPSLWRAREGPNQCGTTGVVVVITDG